VREAPARHAPLTTERLVLLPQTLESARALLAGEDAGLPLADGYPHADTLDALRMFVENGSTDDDGGWFVTLADGRVIGDCGTIGWTDQDGRVEIGYGLAAPYRGKGYGTEAVRVLADWVAAQPGVTAVTAEVEVGNNASRRLLERLGFTLVEPDDRDEAADARWHLARGAT
jgi:RimJ/RimL family protein N-acetyltransferase